MLKNAYRYDLLLGCYPSSLSHRVWQVCDRHMWSEMKMAIKRRKTTEPICFAKWKQENIHTFCWSRHGWHLTRSLFHDHCSLLCHFCFLILGRRVFLSNECTRLHKTLSPLLEEIKQSRYWLTGLLLCDLLDLGLSSAMSFTKQWFLHCSHGGIIERRMVLLCRNLVLSFSP